MSGLRRVDQGMAAAAAAILGDEPIDRTLRTRYRQLPVMLHTAGLAATYAFVLSKSGGDGKLSTAYEKVAKGIRMHLVTNGLLPGCTTEGPLHGVLNAMANCDSSTYARAAAEITALAGWLSRLAEARYQSEPSTEPARPSAAESMEPG
jgi:CRISPR type III-B/RAMP module-associated protein Cmr5